MKLYLQKLMAGESLTLEEMTEAARKLFAGEASESESGALLGLLALKGETAEEIAGLVKAIRERSTAISGIQGSVTDNCGTGGDGSKSFNISTTSAFVIAGAGITIAKHGNRSVSSQTGSADVLEQLGVSLNSSPEETAELLKENGITFLFAPNVHPGMKAVMKVRQDLRVPTIFNLIGPLTNPVQLDTQLLGIYRRDKLMLMGEVLKKLGRKRAVIINGANHMDEASLAGENHLVILENGELKKMILRPEEVGLPTYSIDEIAGGDADRNARIMMSVLKGDEGPFRDTVILNAGIGIFAHGKVDTIQAGIQLARESLDSGAALSKLEYLIEKSKQSAKMGVV
ncbi:anthranilate phosphoribosyltransferase [Lederbergia lenta]|uniref:Anthranilate phosphoribosyltransferase n=1 Tax=Lederbergia lenta TaxID=1467 RepID=A0A2X4YND6_LEDLE|nr:anthranilate phosphoribosyltransferase [Lederbergia lenta]MCM3112310.1 anthranilate phosphoribosyltransferase [Lederbergia lenta]MEC2326530.1 anthranilate phosphoribosyltransferase [Lederbergia lenta]SQI53225.1 anthranilate phosphoribosyltransferase [Lederbergia lenta]